MNDIAKEYAAGLYALAEEDSASDEILAHAKILSPLITREWRRMLTDPALPKAERLRMVSEALSGRVHPYLVNFIRLMTERGLASEIPAALGAYEDLYCRGHNILKVRAESAVELTSAQRERLETRLAERTGHTVAVEYSVNPALIGGMRLFYDNRQLDDTVRRRLDDIASRLSGASV